MWPTLKPSAVPSVGLDTMSGADLGTHVPTLAPTLRPSSTPTIFPTVRGMRAVSIPSGPAQAPPAKQTLDLTGPAETNTKNETQHSWSAFVPTFLNVANASQEMQSVQLQTENLTKTVRQTEQKAAQKMEAEDVAFVKTNTDDNDPHPEVEAQINRWANFYDRDLLQAREPVLVVRPFFVFALFYSRCECRRNSVSAIMLSSSKGSWQSMILTPQPISETIRTIMSLACCTRPGTIFCGRPRRKASLWNLRAHRADSHTLPPARAADSYETAPGPTLRHAYPVPVVAHFGTSSSRLLSAIMMVPGLVSH